MMKRLISLLAAMMLLISMTAMADSNAYDLIENALYRIILRTDDRDILLGSGVLFLEESILLTSAGCVQEGSLYAIGTDGEHAIRAANVLDHSGAALMEMIEPSTNTPLHMANDDSAGMACIFGVDASDNFLVAPLFQLRETVYHQQNAMLLSSSEGLLPGGFLTDEHGDLIGLTIAQHTEGTGVYLTLDTNTLYRAITRQQYADAFLPVEASYANGLLTLTWTDEARTEGNYLITLSADDNIYYTFFETPYTDHSLEIHVAPGHRYDFQVQWAKDHSQAMEPIWGAMTEIIIPSATFTDYQYEQVSKLVTRTTDHAPIIDVSEPTLDQMSNKNLLHYLQVTASYDVEKAIQLPMTIEIISPDGQFYYESAVCTLSPHKEKEDSFLLPLDALLADCAEFSGGILQPGQYKLRYALGGGLAGVYAFTITDTPVADIAVEETVEIDPNQPISGIITDTNAKVENGAITLTWSEENIPNGATVDVFYFYEDNSYYMYQRMHKGEHETTIFTVPGRNTVIWVTWTLDTTLEPPVPQKDDECIIVAGMPETPFTLNGFKNQRLSVVYANDPTAAEQGKYLPEATLTREDLTNQEGFLYFQTEDTYQVSENSDSHPMMIVLCTPEGVCFTYPLEYLFDVTLQSSDMWMIDITPLCREYESAICGAWPAGDYRILYCIDGQIAGEINFTLDEP